MLLGFLKAQNINIPDANFKQYLVSNFDTNGDGEIQQSEALSVTTIGCESKNITSLEGIKSFSNLENLYCPSNNIINLDLQNLTKLTSIDCSLNNNMQSLNIQGLINLVTLKCYYNRLPSLNIQGLTSLTNLYCYGNKFTTLDASFLPNLKTLHCYSGLMTSLNVSGSTNIKDIQCESNELTSLNVDGLVNLYNLDCSYNNLSTLNINNLTKLVHLECSNNQLTSLTLKNLTSLMNLMCSRNQLTTLDVSGLSALGAILCDNNKLTKIFFSGEYKILNNLFCYNNLFESLDLNNLPNLQSLECYNNPNLKTLLIKNGNDQTSYLKIGNTNYKYICCDESEIDYIQNLINQLGLQNQCSVNTYCSFTPGGNFNTLQGTTKFDINNNGCDSNDTNVFPIKYSISDGSTSGIIVGANDGNYSSYTEAGTYTITPIFENPDYFIASPQNHQFVFVDNNTQTKDFCITSNGTKNDLEVKIIPETSVRPGFNTNFKLIYKNKGNTVLSGNVNFNFDSTKSQYISADVSPNSQTTGNLLWNYDNLKPFESRTVNLILKTNPPPIVNVNDELVYSSSINPTIEDLTADDNTFVLHQIVVGSFDPNDKICLEGSTISPEMIGKYITYKIRFENTGTANAEQVVIKDDINTSMFDVNSIIPITASHSYQTRITDNIVEFIFENINLPFDDEHNDGYIVFKIKSLPNLVVGSELKNKADIFFDYNLPITTNEFVTHIQTLNTQEVNSAIKINIYPNPVKHYLNIQTNDKIMSIEIFDLNGRILQNIISSETKINVSNLKKGIYIIKINTSKGSTTQKIIKD